MAVPDSIYFACALAPATLMAALAGAVQLGAVPVSGLWRVFRGLSLAALAWAGLSLVAAVDHGPWPGVVTATSLSLVLALLVQLLGTVIAAFSARYLEGEANQQRYAVALAAVLASVHLLLLADHWLLLIAAWAAVGMALQRLLCFYEDRPFALLAAHKKRIADRLADLMLLGAAGLARAEVGSWSLTALWAHIDALWFLQPPGFEVVPEWRWQQEQALQAGDPSRKAMDRAQVERFVQHYERTSRQALRTLPAIADRVVPLDAERRPAR